MIAPSSNPNRVTIADIARHANVSKATVSRVINNPELVAPDKRQVVLNAIEQMGFEPNAFARSLASGQSMTIGIVTQNIGTSFYDAIIRAIISTLKDTPYSAIFSDGLFEKSAETAAIRTLSERHVDGLIVLGGDVSSSELDEVRAIKPLVVVARELLDYDGVCIRTDNKQLGYEATKFLIDHGHTEIGHIAGIHHHEDAILRQKGYEQALADAGITLNPNWIYQGNFYGQAGVLAVESWLSRGVHFSAIFAANDLTAYGAALALSRRRIRVPDEVSLIGIDDKLESALSIPPLTSIRQPATEMGHAAARAMLDLLSGRPASSQCFQGQMIVRESVSRKH